MLLSAVFKKYIKIYVFSFSLHSLNTDSLPFLHPHPEKILLYIYRHAPHRHRRDPMRQAQDEEEEEDNGAR